MFTTKSSLASHRQEATILLHNLWIHIFQLLRQLSNALVQLGNLGGDRIHNQSEKKAGKRRRINRKCRSTEDHEHVGDVFCVPGKFYQQRPTWKFCPKVLSVRRQNSRCAYSSCQLLLPGNVAESSVACWLSFRTI